MKILLCLTPQIRPFSELSLHSLDLMIVRRLPTKPDLIGHFVAPNRNEIECLASACNIRKLVYAEDPVFDPQLLSQNLGLDTVNSLRNNLLQWSALSKAADAKREIEARQGKYDLVLWSRPDLLFLDHIEEIVDVPPKTLWLSPHDSWGAYNDRFCFGDSDAMDIRMRVFEHFTSSFRRNLCFKRLLAPLAWRTGLLWDKYIRWNAETVLAHLIRKRNLEVRKTNAVFCRVKEDKGKAYVMLPKLVNHDTAGFSNSIGTFSQSRFSLTNDKVDKLYASGKVGPIATDPRERFMPLTEFSKAWPTQPSGRRT